MSQRHLLHLAALAAALACAAASPAVAADGYRLGDPRLAPGAGTFAPGQALSGAGGTALLLNGTDVVVHRDTTGTWRRLSVGRPRTSALRAAEIEQGGFMLLWDDGLTLKTRIVRADGRAEAPQTALTDARLVWEGDFEAPLWQVQDDGAGTVVVASRAAWVPNQSGGGVIAAIREPGGGFRPQQTVHPTESSSANMQSTVAISPIASDGSVSVGWDLAYHSRAPWQGLNGPWQQATRTGRGATFGPPSDPSTGPFGTPRDIDSAQTSARGSQPITVGADVVALCQTRWVACLDRQVLPLDGKPSLVFTLTTEGIQDALGGSFVRETLLEGLWAAQQGADGVFGQPRRITYTFGLPAVASMTGRGLLLAGPSPDTEADTMVLTPVGRNETSSPPTARGQQRFVHSGRRSAVHVWCTRRCTLSARARYDGRTITRTPVFPGTVPTPPRRTLDPGEAGLVPVRLTAGPTARRLELRLTARDDRGRTRTSTLTYRRTGNTWRLVRR